MVKVDLITGFLGSGKTTFIRDVYKRQLLEMEKKNQKIQEKQNLIMYLY